MNLNDKFWGVVEFVLWIILAYTILYSINNPTNLWTSAIIIVALGYAAAVACPIFRQTKAFKEVYKRK